MPDPSDDILTKNNKIDELAILEAKTELLFAGVNSSVIATIIISLFLVTVMWPVIDHEILIFWFLVVFAVAMGRFLIKLQYQKYRQLKSHVNLLFWHKLFFATTLVAALVWSSTALYLFPESDLARQIFLAFAMGGVISGALTTLTYVKPLVLWFLFTIMVPFIFRFFISESELGIEISSMLIFYLLMMSIAAVRIHKNLKMNILLHLESIEREYSLQQSKQYYQTILETATDLYFLYQSDGQIIDVNFQSCNELGYSREELLTLNISDITFIENKKPNGSEFLIESKHLSRLESVHLRKDGSHFPIEMSIGRVNTKEGVLYSAFVRDVTERQRIDKMKNEFVSTVSHELRTPLTSIRGALGLILGGVAGKLSAQLEEMIKLASSNTERLLLLINDILDIQKIESGDMNFQFEKINLSALVEVALKENEHYALEHNVRFVMGDTIESALVLADENRLKQVLANLLSNAAKFTKANDDIIVTLTASNTHFIVSVTDHGFGIAPEFFAEIFTKFTQSDSSDIRQKGGTGLGLNISKLIIDNHNGTLNFNSKVGEGSTFFFELEKY